MKKDKYFSGESLIGDDYTLEQIKDWHDAEKEAYAELEFSEKKNGSSHYYYHEINTYYGFGKIPPALIFRNVLAFGAAFGDEVQPIAERITHYHIIEPSDRLKSEEIFGLKPVYKKPSLSGKLDYRDGFFDLITCFGTLHHIPNVSYVLKDMHRCLKPGGYLLIREPINSMGDWRRPRGGLTARERGIPIRFFDQAVHDLGFVVVSRSLFFCAMSYLQRKIGRCFKKPLFAYPFYIRLDHCLSRVFGKKLTYHRQTLRERLAPSNVFYVLLKPGIAALRPISEIRGTPSSGR